MERTRKRWAERAIRIALAVLFSAGCRAAPPAIVSASLPATTSVQAQGFRPQNTVQQTAHFEEPGRDGPLTLEKLLAIAEHNHPELAIAQARAEAARGRLIQAGLYPNPEVGWEADELGHNGDAAGEQGPVLSQEIVTAGKLGLAQAAAAQGVAASDWQAITRRFEILTRVRTAFYELLIAQREVEEIERIVRLFGREGEGEEQGLLKIAEGLKEAGIGAESEVLRARLELDEQQLALAVAQKRLQAARKQLAIAIGVSVLPEAPIQGDFPTDSPSYDWQQLLGTVLSRSFEIRETEAHLIQAQHEAQRAQADAIPNLHARVRPFYAFPDDDMRLMIEVGASLPLFNRNQGNIAAARAETARAAAEIRQTELRLTERLTDAFRRYESARRQVEIYEKEVLPDAERSLRLVRAEIRNAREVRAAFLSLLEAHRTAAGARLKYIHAIGELWRAVAEIDGLLQVESGSRQP